MNAPPAARSLFDLVPLGPDDESELLRHRFLCRGGGMLLFGPTGIGKSSFSMQAMILWSIGKPCFDIQPTRPLKSLLIQAENDDGDLAEFRDGVCKGLTLTAAEIELARKNVVVVCEDSRTSALFFIEVIEPLLKTHSPDLLWIDPALAYLGGETMSQKDVGAFLRTNLNPLLHKYRCASVIIHHTNKPAKGNGKADWQASEFAYLGSGSAEWANWPRAILALRFVGSNSVFELNAPKRGGRLGWKEADGKTKSYTKLIAHAEEPDAIYWRDAGWEETTIKINGKVRHTKDELLCHVPSAEPIPKSVLLQKTNAAGIGQNSARAFLDELVHDKTLHVWRRRRARTNPEILIARFPQPETEL